MLSSRWQNHKRRASLSELHTKIQKNTHPPPNEDGPSKVKIGVYIESLGKFQSAEMSFDADLYLYMSWKDSSLNHTEPEYILINDAKIRDHIWFPDLYFSNARSAKYHDVLVPNFSMFVSNDGTIAYSGRITITVACNLNLVNYPMDRQRCQIRTLSYAYIASKVNITWFTNEPIRFNQKIGLPEFLIEKIHPSYCDGTYRYAIMDTTFKYDAFSCLDINIWLRRSITYHVVQSFIPTALIVMISWVSFWIDRRAVPARVTLSFTTLLSLSTLGNGLRMGLPQVSYAKALDLWFGVCMFFVFLNLLEFAFVNSYMRQAEKYEKMARTVSKRGEKNAPVDSRLPTEDEEPPLSKDSIFLYSQNGNPIRRAAASMSPSGFVQNNPLAGFGCSPFPTRYSASTSNDIELRDTGISSRRTPKSDSVFMPLDESPTKTTFVSEDEWDVPFGSRRPIVGGNQYTQMHPRNRRRPQQRRSFASGRNPMANNEFIRTGFDYSRKGLRVDKWSRVLFPAGFFVFNVLYWGYYLWFLRRNSNYDDFDGPGE
ncbi:Glycine receptor subunit beta-type 4 [Aphelenchoides besseyi]|nr:Glycine receptor subunit beta-type 4 [Aphelenchoides besseyi]